HVASVESLDTTVLEAVIDTGGVDARVALAKQLCTLVAAEDTPESERLAVLPVMLKLAVDEERAVRAVLAEELASIANTHADLLFCVIAGEDEIALPFLKVTPALNPWHMVAILRVGDEARQCTVASRHDITAEAAAYIIKSSPVAVVLALMDNELVKLEAADMQALYVRLGQSGPLVDRLLALPHLPLDIRITQAKRAATRMRQLMAERSWLPANDASDLVADAEDMAVLQVLINASVEDLLKAISFLAAKNLLTPALIIRAACLGEMRVVEASLAHLSGYAPARAASLMYARGGMKSMVSKCGLPQSCAGVLSAFADVVVEAREEGLSLSRENFGRRLLEALMTRYEMLSPHDRAKQIEYVGRFAEERVRKIARQLKNDIQRAA
ncbi:MAG: DUF2336 domain-containing protein, partial [Phyllobacteriaceae bacterium]|nr:DUF2336 domain-containing protein [Phyllobacteriaceae bacterium]